MCGYFGNFQPSFSEALFPSVKMVLESSVFDKKVSPWHVLSATYFSFVVQPIFLEILGLKVPEKNLIFKYFFFTRLESRVIQKRIEIIKHLCCRSFL